MCGVFLHRQGSLSRSLVDSVTDQCPTQHVKYVNRNALSMFKALNKGCKYKCAVLLLNQVEGRLKSLKIQHRFFS